MKRTLDQVSAELKNIDKEQFNRLFTDYYINLCRFAYTYVRDTDLAEEIVQELFISLWEKREILTISSSVRSFLYTSVKNKALNYIRDEKTRLGHESEFAMEQSAKVSQIINFCEREELIQLIGVAIEELPDQCRVIFELQRNEGLSYNEIAQKLNISSKTVENQMSIALKKLRAKLAPYLTLIITIL